MMLKRGICRKLSMYSLIKLGYFSWNDPGLRDVWLLRPIMTLMTETGRS
jgi:hypothetical protein